MRSLVAAIAGCVLLGVLASTASAAVSPIGLWKAENGRMYRWSLLAPGVYGEYAMTSHRTSTNHCLVKPNTLAYRYHAIGGGLYRVDSVRWSAGCATHWSLNDETIKISVTPTRMTYSCDKQYGKVCWTYTRTGDTQAPKVRALESTGTVGGDISLRYVVSDDSGRTWEAVTFYRDGVVAARYRTALSLAKAGRLYAYRLRQTPPSARGTSLGCRVLNVTSTLVGAIYRGVKVSCWRATATAPLPGSYGVSISDKMAGVFRFDAAGHVTSWGVMRRQPTG